MLDPIATGSCQCGAVRYSLRAASREMHHCHCSMCRKCHAAMFGTYATIEREHFVIEVGRAELSTHKTSPEVERHFCRNCGSHIVIDVSWEPDLVWFTPGTLDSGHPGHSADTERHIWVGSKSPLFEISDALPQNEEF